jgi:hypothetical protein
VQSQCLATLATLLAIKHPGSVAFVNQANIAQGPQQIIATATDCTHRSTAREHSGVRQIRLLPMLNPIKQLCAASGR